MSPRVHLIAAALCALLAAPVFAQQTTAPTTPSTRPPATAPGATTAPSRGATPGATQPQGGLVDINSASAQELDKLPGIGPSRAQAIIANRPYKGKDDLVQRKIVPQSVYDQIQDKIVARQGTRQGAPATGSTAAPSRTAPAPSGGTGTTK